MYFGPPPQQLVAELFATVPDPMRTGPGGKRLGFLEGPSFDRAGNLLCVDVQGGRVYRISPGRDWEILVEYDGIPNGLKLHRDGRAFIADRKNGLMVLDPATGKIDTLLSGPAAGQRFKGLNDLHFAANGDLYFTDQGRTGLQDPTGCVYRLSATGSLDCIIANAPSPNGLVLNKRENALFLAVTRANRARRSCVPRRLVHTAFRRRPRRHRARRRRQPRGRASYDRRGLAVQPHRRAAVLHQDLRQGDDHQRRVRRSR
jgi:gluconolactonase